MIEGSKSVRVLFAALALAASASAAAQATDPPGTRPVVVVNDRAAPVPVTGNVAAQVTGTVQTQLVGPVDVRSVPLAVTDRLDLVLDRLEDIAAAAASQGAQKPADTLLGYEWATRDFEVRKFGSTVLVSQITVYTENDTGVLRLCNHPEGTCTPGSSITLGTGNAEFPRVIVLPFPQPVPLRALTWNCLNSVNNCEVRVNVVGTRVYGN